jgi:hypothetical protein
MENEKVSKFSQVNWEKIGIYFAVLLGYYSLITGIGDLRERVAKLEVKNAILMNEYKKNQKMGKT